MCHVCIWYDSMNTDVFGDPSALRRIGTWMEENLSADVFRALTQRANRLRFEGHRSQRAAERKELLKIANRAERTYAKWVREGEPAASLCRVPGRQATHGLINVTYFPFRNCVERFYNDSRWYLQMTEDRVARGFPALTLEDMYRACRIRADSRASGASGHQPGWRNPNPLTKAEREQRGYVTIIVPREEGDGRGAQRIPLSSFRPAESGTGAPGTVQEVDAITRRLVATPTDRGDYGTGTGGKGWGKSEKGKHPRPTSSPYYPSGRNEQPRAPPAWAPGAAPAAGSSSASSSWTGPPPVLPPQVRDHRVTEQERLATAAQRPTRLRQRGRRLSHHSP